MKCIGRNCVYNKCNSGNFCGLPWAFPTQEGDNCVIDKEIELSLLELNSVKERYERMLSEKENIINNQNIIRR